MSEPTRVPVCQPEECKEFPKNLAKDYLRRYYRHNLTAFIPTDIQISADMVNFIAHYIEEGYILKLLIGGESGIINYHGSEREKFWAVMQDGLPDGINGFQLEEKGLLQCLHTLQVCHIKDSKTMK
jgi:hypothetical protein